MPIDPLNPSGISRMGSWYLASSGELMTASAALNSGLAGAVVDLRRSYPGCRWQCTPFAAAPILKQSTFCDASLSLTLRESLQ